MRILYLHIVTSTMAGTRPGYIDNWYGFTGMVYFAGNGTQRTKFAIENCVIDLIPVDIVGNCLIASAWHMAATRNCGAKVFNCVSGAQNPITWRDFVDKSIRGLIKNPLEGVILYPSLVLRQNYAAHLAHQFVAQTIPAYLMDGYSRLMGKNAR